MTERRPGQDDGDRDDGRPGDVGRDLDPDIARMVDVHCHYLPAVDDGARGIQDAIALIRRARRDGARDIVLTPHVFAGRWDNTLGLLRPRFRAFRQLVESKEIDVRLHLGAEVHLLPESLQLLEQDDVPYVGGWDDMRVLLLELPDARIPPNAISGVRHLLRLGVLPMIAHPERNKAVMDDVDAIEPFVAAGCLLQLTAASLVGEFGDRAARASRTLIERGWATMVATDSHNLKHRPPRLSAARRWLSRTFDEDLATELTETAPGRLVAGRAPLGLDRQDG